MDNCGCGMSDCELCAPTVTYTAAQTANVIVGPVVTDYGDANCWTPAAATPTCSHDWKDSHTVKGKTKWCRKCGERE